MSRKNIVDHQRDYEQLMFRKRQMMEQQFKPVQMDYGAPVQTDIPITVTPIPKSVVQPPIVTQDGQLNRYNSKLTRKDYIPSMKCKDMIMDWCRMQFSTSRIVASRCYKQAKEYFDSSCRKKEALMGLKQRIKISDEDLAKFWGIEMEFKVKKIFRDCFGLVIDECEMFHHAKDRTVVARPDGLVKSGLSLTYLPANLETSFELKGLGSENWLSYEGKAPISGKVPQCVKKDHFLQCLLEMACSGCKANIYNVWTPYCLSVWIIYWDQEFWNNVLKPLYFQGKVNFDYAGRPLDQGQQSDQKLVEELEHRTPEQFNVAFDNAIDACMKTNVQRMFLAQKLSQNGEWRFESVPVAPGQAEMDSIKVTTIPVSLIQLPPERAVYWQQTPNLDQFVAIQRTIFVNQ